MTETREQKYENFRKISKRVFELAGLDQVLNGSCTEPSMAQSFAERKAMARKEAIEGYGMNPDAPDWEINNSLAADINPARSLQEQHYAENLEDILASLPKGNLEKFVLGIQPHKTGDGKHDELVEMHENLIGYNTMLEQYNAGRDVMSGAEDRRLRRGIAKKAAEKAVESDEIKKNLGTIKDKRKRETAKALIEWAHYSQVYIESGGDRMRIYAEGKSELKRMGEKLYKAMSEAGISKEDYAIGNLRAGANAAIESGNPEAIPAQIKQVYDLGKAA